MDATTKKILFGACVLLAIVGGLLYYSNQGIRRIPASFTEARGEAAGVSQDIVALTTKTNKTIEAINAAESAGDINQALYLIDEARTTNVQAQKKAFELSKNLQKMTESLQEIGPRESQQLAYEAIAIELSLTSEFITYTGALNDFLNTLAKTIATGGYGSQQSIAQSLATVNTKAALINDLNRQFNDKMKAFDASL